MSKKWIVSQPTKKDAAKILSQAVGCLPYWVGYKHARFPYYPLPEASIVSELREILLSLCDIDSKVGCEVAYKTLGLKDVENNRGRPSQADLVIFKKSEKQPPGIPVSVIEVKRGRVVGQKGLEDLQKLRKLKRDTEIAGIRTFFVLVTESARPSLGIAADGRAKRSVVEVGMARDKIKLKVRRVARAVGHISQTKVEDKRKNLKSQFWVVLYEVI